ncbi:MAG: hypothetical protein UT97_C0012G0030 [Parcubacteria group bacterium GW2011_GWC2_40_31]|nr:MAG: hypothetical protein UT71_C0010G0019 [Parcubacteria group bacterium GW2011_GWF2_40_10]KKR59742.1 MAG: hypothetical protein UT97_C0012G0030 [Parcubacteria group bacterium GW2011_GWC2_40_31]KKR77096.1 MAG: hypothetical protein UU20_C0016G0011 [Parcubacteria group bacterium GW2011_GWE2_40_8]KKR81725.1 MAG: hypothetical protein UU28_C0021G0015 [Parcubacteria group bacterium GW2011_GWD2_40_9]
MINRINQKKMAEKDKEFLEYVVKALVDNPDAVTVDRKVDEMGVLMTLKTDPADMGKIIGRSGNTAKAIRTLLRVVGMKNNARVNLKIEEPEGSTRPQRSVDDAMNDLNI